MVNVRRVSIRGLPYRQGRQIQDEIDREIRPCSSISDGRPALPLRQTSTRLVYH
jgi:hypothetical protein